MASCLVVEDAIGQATNLVRTLRAAGHEAVHVQTAAEAKITCRQVEPEVILLDLGLPDSDGLELIPELLALCPLARIVVLTGRDSVAAAVTALRAGARHYLVKPYDQEELLLVVEREAHNLAWAASVAREQTTEVFWGSHPEMVSLRSHLYKLAASPLTAVLVEGETGSGKEIVARELHRVTAATGPFVAVNCAAIPGELIESELFGHERGAFTSAESRRRGLVELARNGTLFLDEVAEMSPPAQAKMLRFLEDYRFRRVGGEEELTARCRVVAATNRDLRTLAGSGGFRADLFFRLAVVRLRVLPLRERREDIVPLAYFLLTRFAKEIGRPWRPLSAAAEAAVSKYAWPGNVRELRNRLERAVVLGEGPLIEPGDLDLEPLCHVCLQRKCRCSPFDPALATATSKPLAEGELAEAERIARAWKAEGYSIARTARRLGVARHWLKYRLVKYGIRGVEGK